MKQANSSHLESLGEHLSDLLFAESTCTLENFGVAFRFFFLLAAASTRADGAAQYLCPPPAVNGTLGMGKPQDGVGICKSPCVRCLGKTRYNVERGERERGGEGLNGGDFTGGTCGYYRSPGCGRDRLHGATMLNTKDTGGLV